MMHPNVTDISGVTQYPVGISINHYNLSLYMINGYNNRFGVGWRVWLNLVVQELEYDY